MTFYGNGIGGDAAVFMDLAESLLALGLDVTLAPRADNQEVMAERAGARGMPIFPVNHWHSWGKETGLEPMSFDLVHLHHCSNYVLATQARDFAVVFRGKPMVATLHGPEPLEEFLTLRRGVSARLGARFFEALVVPSRHKWEAWRQRGFFGDKLRQIPNPIRGLKLGDSAAAKASFGLSREKPCLLFLGRIRPEKTPGAVLAALPAIRNKRIEPSLLFVGTGDEALKAQLQETCRELGVESRFPGFVADPSSAYSAADAFLFTSRYDNFPISLFEAAAAGIPVVASDIPVVRHEFAGSPGVHIYGTADLEGMACAVRNALRASEDDRARLKDDTLARFGFAAIGGRHRDLYEELLARAAP